MNTQVESIKLDISKPLDSLKFINNALNKAAKNGVYTIDESYTIKVALSFLDKYLEDYIPLATQLNETTDI